MEVLIIEDEKTLCTTPTTYVGTTGRYRQSFASGSVAEAIDRIVSSNPIPTLFSGHTVKRWIVFLKSLTW